ncbi:MAG: bifunctional hydroxymethylpyrimidine kinase/phosphomethylpyrimidine kinase [bacterium]
MKQAKRSLLCIAGFDPTAGAGILVDSAVFRALGFHPLAVLSSVTAQGNAGVQQIKALPKTLIKRQLSILFDEFQPEAVKIGMLYSEAAARVVADFLHGKNVPVVVDPVLRASSGGFLARGSLLPMMEKRIFPKGRIITPNLAEAGHFLGWEISGLRAAERAAVELQIRWGCAVLLKGGHLSGEPVDVFADLEGCETFKHPRFHQGSTIRGTGCALSAAIAAGLADRLTTREAVLGGIEFVQEAIERATPDSVFAQIRFLDFPSKPR